VDSAGVGVGEGDGEEEGVWRGELTGDEPLDGGGVGGAGAGVAGVSGG
jgi:hypothetical protein